MAATKSDFAQKLLGDLRLRKQRMAAAQNSNRHSPDQMSREKHGNATARTYKGAQQPNVIKSAVSRTGNSNRSSNRGTSFSEPPNQIVLYERGGQSSGQVCDLSTAIAFAFENSGKLTRIGSNNPLVNFFNRFGRRSMDCRKMDNQFHVPAVSQVHIAEISKGVEKLNQILRVCSNNGIINFDINSFQVGRELLKGSIDLEDSLRLLVNFPDAVNGKTQQKSRITFLDEDGEEETGKTAEQWQLSRPRFSFDNNSRNSYIVQDAAKNKIVSHKRSTSYYDQDYSLSTKVKGDNGTPEKGRISNVIAKLMGLDELPLRENSMIKNEEKEKKERRQRKVFQNNERELNLKEDRERKLPQKAQNRKMTKVEDHVARNKTERTISATYMEKKNEVQVVKKPQSSEYKRRVEERDQQLEKRNFLKQKREDDQVKLTMSSKPKKIGAVNEQKKIFHQTSAPTNGKPTHLIEKVPKKESPNSRKRDEPLLIDITAAKEEHIIREEDKSRNLYPQINKKEQCSKLFLKHNKPIPASAIENKAVSQKVHKSENRSKIDAVMTRRNAYASHLKRSVKQSANTLQDWERPMRSKTYSSKIKEIQSDSKDKDGEVDIIMSNSSEISTETPEKPADLQNEAQRVILVTSSVEDECQTQNTPTSPTPNANCNDPIAAGEVSDYVQTARHEEETELFDATELKYKHFASMGRQEHLTEAEKELKEIVIQSQLFLNTAEALFKLNIPISFLHVNDHSQEAAGKKLVLDCGCEIMKRKARRRETTLHPYMKTSISVRKLSSLDDLVKRLCKDIEALKTYGGNGSDVAEKLHIMLDKDIYSLDPDVNNMWDFEWNKMTYALPEKEDVVTDLEKHMLNGLLDEITNDLLLGHVLA